MRNNLKDKYHTQRRGAIQRGIDWQFTYDEWIAWWGDDIEKRGHYSGQLVMARIGDKGPYHPNNVKKITCNENIREGNLGIPAPQKACPGPRNGMWGKQSAMKGRKQTPFGLASIVNRAKSDNNKLVKIQLTCPHCGIQTNKGNALRWHFDNCKKVMDPGVG